MCASQLDSQSHGLLSIIEESRPHFIGFEAQLHPAQCMDTAEAHCVKYFLKNSVAFAAEYGRILNIKASSRNWQKDGKHFLCVSISWPYVMAGYSKGGKTDKKGVSAYTLESWFV